MDNIAVHRQLASLQTSVDHMLQQWASQEATATAGRRALHEKFEAFRTDVGLQISGLSLRVDRLVDQYDDVNKTMKVVEPAVQSFKDEKLRQEGAKRLGKVLIGALTTAAGVLGWALHELVGYLKH